MNGWWMLVVSHSVFWSQKTQFGMMTSACHDFSGVNTNNQSWRQHFRARTAGQHPPQSLWRWMVRPRPGSMQRCSDATRFIPTATNHGCLMSIILRMEGIGGALGTQNSCRISCLLQGLGVLDRSELQKLQPGSPRSQI